MTNALTKRGGRVCEGVFVSWLKLLTTTMAPPSETATPDIQFTLGSTWGVNFIGQPDVDRGVAQERRRAWGGEGLLDFCSHMGAPGSDLDRLHTVTTLLLYGYCAGLTLVLHWPKSDAALVLHWICTGTAPVLYWYYIGTTLVLHW